MPGPKLNSQNPYNGRIELTSTTYMCCCGICQHVPLPPKLKKREIFSLKFTIRRIVEVVFLLRTDFLFLRASLYCPISPSSCMFPIFIMNMFLCAQKWNVKLAGISDLLKVTHKVWIRARIQISFGPSSLWELLLK